MVGLLFLLMIVDGGISAFNAWSVGKVWPERKQAPWFQRLVIYSSATMSASGFTWVYLMILALIATALRGNHIKYLEAVNHLSPNFINVMVSLGYLIIILPVLGSGLVLMAQSWAVAWRNRTFGNTAVAGWNTFANVYNYYEAIQGIPQALSTVIDFFSSLGGGSGSSSKDDDEEEGALIVVLVIAALVAGIFTTAMIIKWSARSHVDSMRARYDTRVPAGGPTSAPVDSGYPGAFGDDENAWPPPGYPRH